MPTVTDKKIQKHNFMRNSFDVDFLTILSKYRPSTKDFPIQFNTNLNDAAYVGYRKYIYQIDYQ